MNKNADSHTGFTLIEVALALGVAAFALVALLGLLPIGLNSNQACIEQTRAASLAAGIVADLRATAVAVPPVAGNSPRYQVLLPASGTVVQTLYLREDGSAAGSVNADADGTLDPRYRVTLVITAPAATTQKAATNVRVLVTWPAMADPKASAEPYRYNGSFEVMGALNRH